ncbi:MAG: serine hydrolase, partial [Solirubrobacterales bacterium]
MRSRRPLTLAVLVAAAIPPLTEAASPDRAPPHDSMADRPVATWPRVTYPSSRAVREAQRFAAGWGDVSFAVVDAGGGLRGYEADRHYSSASASKALLLAAELRRLKDEGEPLDSTTKALLESMITYSDNDAGSGVYARVGDPGLEEVAERAGMRDFEVDPGFWGGAQITAADMARFYYRLERNLVGRYRDYGMALLASITSTQRWGIPTAAGGGWRVWFKGGWRPSGEEGTTGAVTHQAALLVHRSGQRLALAVLSNEAPGEGGG